MKPSSRPRATAELSKSLHHQLNLYALAASAAGVGMLALTQPAEAKIVYTPAHVVFGVHTNVNHNVDLNHDGVNDFVLAHGFNETSRHATSVLAVIRARSSNRILGGGGGGANSYASALVAGFKIGPSTKFDKNHGLMAAASSPSSGLRGYWAKDGKGVKNHYLGLQFVINGKIHYGWARLTVVIGRVGQGFSIKGTLTGYAYETVPNKPVIAGKTKGPDVVTLQPASLGHLATGASAIPAWRVKRTPATAR